jgi:hypothetical protein
MFTLTKQLPNIDVPGQADAGIEITPEMIEAGIAAVRSIEYELWESRSPEKLGHLAVMIFRSMAIAGGFKELEH